MVTWSYGQMTSHSGKLEYGSTGVLGSRSYLSYPSYRSYDSGQSSD